MDYGKKFFIGKGFGQILLGPDFYGLNRSFNRRITGNYHDLDSQAGATHMVEPDVLAPVLTEFFAT